MCIDGEAIRILRERTGIRQVDLAQRLGISAPYLRDIEGGRRRLKRDDHDLLPRIASELAVPVRMIVRVP